VNIIERRLFGVVIEGRATRALLGQQGHHGTQVSAIEVNKIEGHPGGQGYGYCSEHQVASQPEIKNISEPTLLPSAERRVGSELRIETEAHSDEDFLIGP
jgi:hypothetical protein